MLQFLQQILQKPVKLIKTNLYERVEFKMSYKPNLLEKT